MPSSPADRTGRAAGSVKRALVMGGGMLGVGVAHVLAERGADVIVVESGGELAAELGVRPRGSTSPTCGRAGT